MAPLTLSRRSLFGGLALLAAPAIVRTPGLLMPVRPVPKSTEWWLAHGIRLIDDPWFELVSVKEILPGVWMPRIAAIVSVYGDALVVA